MLYELEHHVLLLMSLPHIIILPRQRSFCRGVSPLQPRTSVGWSLCHLFVLELLSSILFVSQRLPLSTQVRYWVVTSSELILCTLFSMVVGIAEHASRQLLAVAVPAEQDSVDDELHPSSL